MHRIDHETADADANGPGRPGFTGGDPELAIDATVVTPAWLNAVQEEIARACELLGPLDAGNNQQLRTLIEAIQSQPSLLGLDNFWTGKNLFSSYIAVRDRIYLNDPAGLDEILYAEDGLGGPVPKRRLREVLLPASVWSPALVGAPGEAPSDQRWGWMIGTNGGFTPHGSGWANSSGAQKTIPGEFQVPSGGQFVKLRVGIKVSEAVTATLAAGYRVATNVLPISNVEHTALYESQSTGVDAILEINGADIPDNPAVWDSMQHTGWMTMRSNGYATIKWTRLQFLDPGPRNI